MAFCSNCDNAIVCKYKLIIEAREKEDVNFNEKNSAFPIRIKINGTNFYCGNKDLIVTP